MESFTYIYEPESITHTDEFGYVAKLAGLSPEDVSNMHHRFILENDWSFQYFDKGYIAMRGERYVRTGGPLDGKTFD